MDTKKYENRAMMRNVAKIKNSFFGRGATLTTPLAVKLYRAGISHPQVEAMFTCLYWERNGDSRPYWGIRCTTLEALCESLGFPAYRPNGLYTPEMCNLAAALRAIA